MSSPTAKPTDQTLLGDEIFMSAEDLRAYMAEMSMAKMSLELNAMDRADKARDDLVKSMSAKIDVTPQKVAELTKTLTFKIRAAAKRGETELMVMRFPNSICSDNGRAINNAEAGWPETLTGRPRQAFEFWRDHLQPDALQAQGADHRLAGRLAGRRRLLPELVSGFRLVSGDPEQRPMDTDAEKPLKRKKYERALKDLHIELVKVQEWVKHAGAKVCVLFEGRDGAGKGGVIKAITERVSPRVFRVIALPPPSEREKSQMYVQRYLPHLPAAGEVVIFDRSWYNRAGVERVMEFCTHEQAEQFLAARSRRREGHRRIRRHPGQVLAGGQPGRADPPHRGAHDRSAQDLETVADGRRIL